MKVLYLTNTLNPKNGWGRFSKELIEGVEKLGVEVRALTESGPGYHNEPPALKRTLGAFKCIPEVRKYIKEYKPDIVHSLEGNPYAITAQFACLGFKIKKVISAPGAYSVQPLYNWKTRGLLKWAYRQALAIYPISKYVGDEIIKCVKLKNIKVITLGVDPKKFSGRRITTAAPFIISVGNLSRRKGYQVSVPAFIKIAKQIPNFKYYIAGKIDEAVFKQCQEEVKKNNLQARVIFLGSVGDEKLRELYLSAELFLLASINIGHHFEGFGLVFLEAASAGLPVIGTMDNGIADAVKPGVNGLLVPQNDIDATADAMIKILTNPELKKQMSMASVEWANQNTWEQVAQKQTQAYKELSEK